MRHHLRLSSSALRNRSNGDSRHDIVAKGNFPVAVDGNVWWAEKGGGAVASDGNSGVVVDDAVFGGEDSIIPPLSRLLRTGWPNVSSPPTPDRKD